VRPITTFWDVLFGADPFESKVSGDALRLNPAVSEAIERAAQVDRGAIGKVLSGTLSDHCRELMSVPLSERIVGAFCGYRELLQYTDSGRFPAEKETIKSYAKKKLPAILESHVELRVDGRAISALAIKAALVLESRGVVLAIRGGRIRQCTIAEIDAGGEFFIGSKQVYSTPKLTTFSGFSLRFEHGLPIAPWKDTESLAHGAGDAAGVAVTSDPPGA
jgi:hypothetical protein